MSSLLDEFRRLHPWFDGKVIYRSGDAATPMAIAVTERDAAEIVVALAAIGRPHPCMHNDGTMRPGPSGSMFCEAPSVATVIGAGPRCLRHIATLAGAQVAPVDHHPDLGSAVRQLLSVWKLPEGAERDAWVAECVGNLFAMQLGFVSRLRGEKVPGDDGGAP